MNPLLVPPMLVLRALDDLHTLATSVPRALAVVERLDARGEEIVALGERALASIDRLDERGVEIVALAEKFEALGEGMAAEAHAVQQSAHDVVAAAREITAALPLLERAIALGEPLEGAVERVGRIVDRLPGGRTPRT